ncbi:hypothetical protein EJ08DRAFT_664427 [Tothia fuscella]|uniref:Uncharacterized protein n=1 Tax=Tothia fuscella TaxID=1048955 RepID=A0A9P4TV36_9PEZI|nr:hypothetical protein EJ08DRAFT_664427 [Tothia fuscella]
MHTGTYLILAHSSDTRALMPFLRRFSAKAFTIQVVENTGVNCAFERVHSVRRETETPPRETEASDCCTGKHRQLHSIFAHQALGCSGRGGVSVITQIIRYLVLSAATSAEPNVLPSRWINSTKQQAAKGPWLDIWIFQFESQTLNEEDDFKATCADILRFQYGVEYFEYRYGQGQAIVIFFFGLFGLRLLPVGSSGTQITVRNGGNKL